MTNVNKIHQYMSAALAEKNPSKTLGSKGLEPLAKEYDHKCHVVTKEIGAPQVYSAAPSIIAELKLIVDSEGCLPKKKD